MKKIWLISTMFMVLLMIFVGGYTRLSGAGLSIVEWKPATGIIPPISSSQWMEEFSKYQGSPEFIKLNTEMNISEFKRIFLIEYFHRLLGRITFLVFFVPWCFFLLNGKISIKEKIPYVVFVLIIIQGCIGWYMVKSGLIHSPFVSHYRLGLHLVCATIIYSFTLWFFLKKTNITSKGDRRWFHDYLFLLLIYVQIFIGGIVAGLKGGLIYNTFPLMGESFFPDEIFIIQNYLDNPASCQFIHRITAYILLIYGSYIAWLNIQNKRYIVGYGLVLTLLLQILLGILTLIYIVPFSLALLHQISAMLLLSFGIVNLYIYSGK